MALLYRKLMDALYLVCVVVAGTALVLISAVIPWAVFTRYVLNSAASWPEPTAVLLTIVLTFIGAAACYRPRAAHERRRSSFAAAAASGDGLPELLAELLVADHGAVHARSTARSWLRRPGTTRSPIFRPCRSA